HLLCLAEHFLNFERVHGYLLVARFYHYYSRFCLFLFYSRFTFYLSNRGCCGLRPERVPAPASRADDRAQQPECCLLMAARARRLRQCRTRLLREGRQAFAIRRWSAALRGRFFRLQRSWSG